MTLVSQALRLLASHFRAMAEPADRAEQLLVEHNIESFSSMPELARRLGIDIEEVDGLPDTVGGYADCDQGVRFIAINRRMHPLHQEVTVAHELGHHFKHDLQQEYLETPAQRREADMFAMGLLLKSEFYMTSAEFRDANPDISIDVLSPLGVKAMAVIFEIAASIAECFEQVEPRAT